MIHKPTIYPEIQRNGPLATNALRYGISPSILVRTDVDSSTGLIYDAMTVKPDATRLALIDAVIKLLKGQNIGGLNPSTLNVWPKLIGLYAFAGLNATDALINWKSPGTFNGTAVGSPTFTEDTGYNGDGSSAKYIDTNFNLSTGYTTAGIGGGNNAHWGSYIMSNPLALARIQALYGVAGASPYFYVALSQNGGGAATYRRHHVKGDHTDMGNTATTDRHIVCCARATTQVVYINATEAPTSTSANSNIMSQPNDTLKILVGGDAISGVNSTSTISQSFFHWGADLSDAERLVIARAINAKYLTDIGKNGY